jgi:hypothetical protein
MSFGKAILIQLIMPPFFIAIGVFFLVQFGLIRTTHENPLLNFGYLIYSLVVLLFINLFFVAFNKVFTLLLEYLGFSINEFKVSLLWVFIMLCVIFIDLVFYSKSLYKDFGILLILFYFFICSGFTLFNLAIVKIK